MTEAGRPWWEFDPDERPVPLDASDQNAARQAEEIVESERRAIMREDTEPTLQTLAGLRGTAITVSRARGVRRPRGSVRLLGSGLLLLGCVAMFTLGWAQAAAARRIAPDSRPGINKSVVKSVTASTVTDQVRDFDRGFTAQFQSHTRKEVSTP